MTLKKRGEGKGEEMVGDYRWYKGGVCIFTIEKKMKFVTSSCVWFTPVRKTMFATKIDAHKLSNNLAEFDFSFLQQKTHIIDIHPLNTTGNKISKYTF